jgi:hypothetical protein
MIGLQIERGRMKRRKKREGRKDNHTLNHCESRVSAANQAQSTTH